MMRPGYPFAYCFLFFSVVLLMAACARPFSEEILSKVDRSVSFLDLQKNPEKYKGAWVMLAGVVVDVKNTKEGTFFEVLQKPMADNGRPLDTDDTGGRFIARSDGFLDPAVYHRGRAITVVAEVVGRKELPLGGTTYLYPFLLIKDLYLWGPSSGPRFYFGIGVWQRL